jgi:hypothetical protein
VLSEKKFLNEAKNHNPPLMVQMFLKKDKIQRLVGHRPNKKDISNINILYKKIDKKGS